MDDSEWLAGRFEEHRPHLRAVAYRMLGSLTEVDDAVQDAWERVSRAGAEDVENLKAWLTTIVARSVSTCCARGTPGARSPSRCSYPIQS
jgi:RNA polymerase sigma-70 factor (ECF subfamily)